MKEVLADLALQFGVVLIIGAPPALALAARERRSILLGWLMLAPALGVVVLLGIAADLHFLGLGSRTVIFGLLALGCAASTFILGRNAQHLPFRSFLFALCLVALAAIFVILLNATDIGVLGPDAYFPLVNGDTFTNLGSIDQLLTAGWVWPQIHYPAAFAPGSEVYRAPGFILVGDFADCLGLDSHAAYFLSFRLGMLVIILAATGTALLTGGPIAALACLALLALGNFLLPQVLQQFHSSVMGCVIAAVILALAIWTARERRTRTEFLAGAGALGFAAGAMAVASPEAQPLYMLFLGIVFIRLILAGRQFRLLGAALLIFSAAAVIVSAPLMLAERPALWQVTLREFWRAAGSHPGDWVAVPAFLIEGAGLTMLASDSFGAYSAWLRGTAIAFALVLAFAFGALVYRLVRRSVAGGAEQSDFFVIVSCAAVMISVQLVFYALGAGYKMLKATDYFAFLPSIVVAVGVTALGRTGRTPQIRALAPLALVGACVAYGAVAVPAKHRLLHRYRDISAAMPPPSAYRLPPSGSGAPAVVVPDLHGEALELFLFMNRWGPNRLAFQADESHSFRPLASLSGANSWLVRMPRVGIAGLPLADITYGQSRGDGMQLEVLPLAGQIHILPGGGWLDPEGASPGRLLRWLSGHGDFLVFRGASAAAGMLHLDLQPGPDLRSDNAIEISVGGRVLITLAWNELPRLVTVELPVLPDAAVRGRIAITGPRSGLRQIRVGHLRTVDGSP